jgi:hypothetical protein
MGMWEVFAVRDYEKDGEKKSFWMKIGQAFDNKDGSLGVSLDCLPVNGRLQIRRPREEGDQRPGQGSFRDGRAGAPQRRGRPPERRAPDPDPDPTSGDDEIPF